MKKIIGYSILVLIFMGIYILVGILESFYVASLIFSASVIACALIIFAIYLTTRDE